MSRLIRLLITAGVVAAAGVAVKFLQEQKSERKLSDDSDEEEGIHFVKLDDDEGKIYSPEVEEIAALYPYLSRDFIDAELNKNATYSEQFPTDTLVHVTYLIAFTDTEARDAFVDTVAEKGYDVCVSDEMNVQVSRQFFTENGAILSDIYNVANQAACLGGRWLNFTVSR